MAHGEFNLLSLYSTCGLRYKVAYLLNTNTPTFPNMSFNSYLLSHLSGAECVGIEPSTHSDGVEVECPGNFNMQPGCAWASTYSSPSPPPFHVVLGELQGDNIARETQMHHVWRQGTIDYMKTVLPPPTAESRHLPTFQVSVPGNTSFTENNQYPPAASYGSNGVSLHLSPRRISLDEGAPTPVIPLSFSTSVQGGKKRYRCECGAETARKGDMMRHQRYALYHSRAQFTCDQCGKTFTRKDSRDIHEKTCPGILQGEFST